MLNGYKTYIGSACLLGLGLFQLASGQVPSGLHSLFMALITFGLRGAIARLKS